MDVLNYFLRTSARRYLGLAAIAGLSATIVSWFAGLSTTIYTVVECMLRCTKELRYLCMCLTMLCFYLVSGPQRPYTVRI